ncbi:MAG: SRPBCC domain-containing protein, partial [Flavobacterium sp.]
MNTKPLIIESVYDVSVEKVWEALTQNEQLK